MLKIVVFYYSFVTLLLYMGLYEEIGFKGSRGQVIGKQTIEPWNPGPLSPKQLGEKSY
jgi:hypothetical protein